MLSLCLRSRSGVKVTVDSDRKSLNSDEFLHWQTCAHDWNVVYVVSADWKKFTLYTEVRIEVKSGSKIS